MIAGYLLVAGGILQAVVGWQLEVSLAWAIGGLWVVFGLVNVITSAVARRGRDVRVSTDDLANPAARARQYRGTPGQLARGLITLACAAFSVVTGIVAASVTTNPAASITLILCGACLGFLALLGLLLYAASGTERAAQVPATVVILGFKEMPIHSSTGQPYVRFVLDVYPQGMTHYESTVQSLVPILSVPKLAVGAQFSAMVAGPKKPDAVIVDWQKMVAAAPTAPAPAAGAAPSTPAPSAAAPRPAAPAAPSEQNATDRLRELDALRDQGLVTEAEYAEQRARILDSL